MINYWWVTRPKRKLNAVPEILAIFADISLNQEWDGQRDSHLAYEDALEKAGLKRRGERRDHTGGGARTYIQNGWDLNMRLRMEYPEIDDIQNIINRMPSDNARVPNPKEIIVEILKMDCWGIVAHVLIKHGKIKEIKDIIKKSI